MTILESTLLGLNLWYSFILIVVLKFGGIQMTSLIHEFNSLCLKKSILILSAIISNIYFWKLLFEMFVVKISF